MILAKIFQTIQEMFASYERSSLLLVHLIWANMLIVRLSQGPMSQIFFFSTLQSWAVS